jgi:NADP-dependent 3-hydroxy acid dehydrogenase YdfG
MKVIISGASGVLGEAVRSAFLEQGATLCCIARKGESIDAEGARWFTCEDLSDEHAAKGAVARAVASMGGLDALAHVAGAFVWKKVEDSNVADWRWPYREGRSSRLTKPCERLLIG